MVTKMFVNYADSVAAFKQAKNAEGTLLSVVYNNSIVFIGNGEAVYTHGQYYGDVKSALAAIQNTVDGLKYFTSVKAGDVTATAVDKNGVITFTSDENSTVTVNADSKTINIGLDSAFVTKVNNAASSIATEISNRTNADAKLREDLGNKTDSANAEGSAFARIAQLSSDISSITGGNGSVSTQINNAINALDVEAKSGDFVASVKQVDGKIEATMGTFNFDESGAAASAQFAAEKHADSLNTAMNTRMEAVESVKHSHTNKTILDGITSEKITAWDNAESSANSYTDGKVTAINNAAATLEGRVKANEDAIVVINGSGEGSIKKAAADAVATVLDDAPESFDTLKEVADWIASDTTGAAKMQSDIAKLQGADTVEGSVAKQVKDAVNAEALIARAAEKANADAIDAIEADYLKASDKTELSNAINNKVAQSDYDTKIATLEKADSDNLATAKQYTTDEIAKLDVTDSVVSGKYVSAVSETDGKISVTRADLPTYTLSTGSVNGTVAFNGADVVVKGLNSAAYTEASAYATAAQGIKADAAAPQATTYTKVEIDNMLSWEEL